MEGRAVVSEDFIYIEPPSDGWLTQAINADGYICELSGIAMTALPPGKVELHIARMSFSINVVTNSSSAKAHIHRINEQNAGLEWSGPSGTNIFAAGIEHEIVATNPHWECLIQVKDGKLANLLQEKTDGHVPLLRPQVNKPDKPSILLAQMAIDHLRHSKIDRLYVEGLAIALAARGLSIASDVADDVSTVGTDKRIVRALD